MNADPVRRIGRPDQQASEELVRNIVDIAARLFIEQGYAATSIEQVAAAAGSGKQTLYRRFGSKQALFTAVINRQAQHLLERAMTLETRQGDPVEALKESCRVLLDFALQPDLIRLHRILVAEIGRFPDLGDYVLDNCLKTFRTLQEQLLQSAMDEGLLRAADVKTSFALLNGLITGWPVQQALLGRQPFETESAQTEFFEAAWRTFVEGAR